ncbi:MAG: hypothetical protein ABUL72_06890 [Armatimonadota bacterium]
MVRIVGVQRSDEVGQEFVLLQNQGSMRVSMKGYALVTEAAFSGEEAPMCLLTEEVDLHPGMYMLVRSCIGPARWTKCGEGAPVYYAYLGRTKPLWGASHSPVHLLAPQHTYVERAEAMVV